MLERITDPKPGVVAWLADLGMTPCAKQDARFAKLNFDDGGTMWLTVGQRGQAQDAFNDQEPRDEKGEWTDHGSFTLFHGSQYGGLKKFDKAKIGTGEGFQSYGYGFYLARNKDVAESYRDVGDDYPVTAGMVIGGHLLSAKDMSYIQQRAYGNLKEYPDYDAAIKDLSIPKYGHDFSDLIPVLKDWQKQGATLNKGGNVYTVEAKADPDTFLDWDKPLSQQSAAVKKLFGKLAKPNWLGSELPLLLNLRGPGGGARESAAMAKAGIPGIRYLDEGSRQDFDTTKAARVTLAKYEKAMTDAKQRGNIKPFSFKGSDEDWKGELRKRIETLRAQIKSGEAAGTRNYVVFDPKTLTVTHRNGQPIDGGASDTILAGDDFNPSEPRKEDGEWTDGGASGGGKVPSPIISSRNVTAKRSQAGKSSYMRVDTEAMKADPALYKHNVGLFKIAAFYPGMRPDEVKGSTDEIASHVINRMRENLDYIVGLVPKDKVKERAHWYEGAHKLAHDFGSKYKIDDVSAAAVIASLSPRKPWDENVYFADRILDISKNHAHDKWDAKMDAKAKELSKSPTVAKAVPLIVGKRLDELENPAAKAMWIRTYNEAHEDRTFNVVHPDGTFGGKMMTASGKPDHASWGSLAQITNAIMAADSKGDPTTISGILGARHKVRSFYNNIAAPDDPNGDVTVDTHAVGAAWLQPTSGTSPSVFHDLATNPGGEGTDKTRPKNWVLPALAPASNAGGCSNAPGVIGGGAHTPLEGRWKGVGRSVVHDHACRSRGS